MSPKYSAFVQKSKFDMARLKRRKQIEVDDYERHVCRNGWKQVYRIGEKRRERA